MSDTINYGRLMHEALRGLIAKVLEQVAQDGLPGSHHFFIGFDTTHPGVDMPASLRARYPEDMTIVMQEWFEDLAVMPDRFSVTLSFGGMPERLVVPFAAVKTFIDPSVEFGLKFDAQEDDDLEEEDEAGSEADGEAPDSEPEEHDAEIVSLDKFRKH